MSNVYIVKYKLRSNAYAIMKKYYFLSTLFAIPADLSIAYMYINVAVYYIPKNRCFLQL